MKTKTVYHVEILLCSETIALEAVEGYDVDECVDSEMFDEVALRTFDTLAEAREYAESVLNRET